MYNYHNALQGFQIVELRDAEAVDTYNKCPNEPQA